LTGGCVLTVTVGSQEQSQRGERQAKDFLLQQAYAETGRRGLTSSDLYVNWP